MSKEICLTGSSGLVGSRFIELNRDKYNFSTPDYPEFDMTDESQVRTVIEKYKPDVLVNFAAYTNVSEGENQKGNKEADCWRINVIGVEHFLKYLPSSCHFIQISTDMVFPGSKEFPGPYTEDSLPEADSDKVTWYGFTKAETERRVGEKFGSDFTILRLIYPFRAHYGLKPDYLRKPLLSYDELKLYPLFNDQQVSVLFIDSMCPALAKIIDDKVFGVFHASSSDTTTPYELVSYLLEKARGVKNVVRSSSVESVGNPVRYPKFGGLKVGKTEKELGVKFGDWREMVDEFIRQLGK